MEVSTSHSSSDSAKTGKNGQTPPAPAPMPVVNSTAPFLSKTHDMVDDPSTDKIRKWADSASFVRLLNTFDEDRSLSLIEMLEQSTKDLKSLESSVQLGPSGARPNIPMNPSDYSSEDVQQIVERQCLEILNSADKEGLKRLRSIGEARSEYILERRRRTPHPFETFEDAMDELGLFKYEREEMLAGKVNKKLKKRRG